MSRGEKEHEAPVHKKTSPSSSSISTKAEHNSDENYLLDQKVSHQQKSLHVSSLHPVLATPKQSHVRRMKTRSSSVKKKEHVAKCFEIDEIQKSQHSPDSPFISSQLLGTQECEVVWDCNSPGFSKDDLKRMSNRHDKEESPIPVEFIAPIPYRSLFPKTRLRSNNVSTINTTAQLDELLHQVTAKDFLSEENEEEGPALTSYLQEPYTSSVSKLRNSFSRPDVDSDTLSPDRPNLDFRLSHSTQSFTVLDQDTQDTEVVTQCLSNDNNMDSKQLEESVWEDLNVAICDFSGINDLCDSQSDVLSGHGKMLPDKKESVLSSVQVIKVNPQNESRESLDIFDDDYFNDSVIHSTQLWEKEILEKDNKSSASPKHVAEVVAKASYHACNQFQGINKKQGSSSHLGELSKTHHIYQDKHCDLPSKEPEIENNHLESSSSTSEIKCSPIIGKPRVSPVEKTVPRKVRNTFRLDINPNTGMRNNIGVSSTAALNSTSDHVFGINNGNFRMKTINTESSGIINKGHQERRVKSSINENLIKPSKQKPLKSLFTSNSKNIITDTLENRKIPFPRSQSVDNVKVSATKATMYCRSAKSEDAEGGREFEEDDAFFEAVLSTLPEEEAYISFVTEADQHCNMPDNTVSSNFKSKEAETSTSDKNSNKLFRSLRFGQSFVNKDVVHGNNTHIESRLENMISKTISVHSDLIGEHTCSNERHLQTKTDSLKSSGPGPRNSSEDILDDDIFQDDDILTLIDEVESQYGSPPPNSQSSQLWQSPSKKCTSEEIARKKEEARRRREEKVKKDGIMRKKDEAGQNGDGHNKSSYSVPISDHRKLSTCNMDKLGLVESNRQVMSHGKMIGTNEELVFTRNDEQKVEEFCGKNDDKQRKIEEIEKKKIEAERLRREKLIAARNKRLGTEEMNQRRLTYGVEEEAKKAESFQTQMLIDGISKKKVGALNNGKEKMEMEIAKRKEEAERRLKGKLKGEQLEQQQMEKEKLKNIERIKEKERLLREQKQKEKIQQKKEEALRRRQERMKTRQLSFH
ncbi:hypothetical protein SK128_013745 [Halocaridina rubra]|uniref:Uncharacterized protein n=1 Tax=Halocaridina rubra TaxID=373956 RepID=A0AAN8XR56_HALRR